MDRELSDALIDFVEKIGLMRRDMKNSGELERFEARFRRVDQKFDGLAELISRTDPDLAKALRTAWQMPGRSLAFRNAEHQKKLRQTDGD